MASTQLYLHQQATLTSSDSTIKEKEHCYMFHGVLGSSANLLSVAKMIHPYVCPFLFDLPNHGQSPHISPGNWEHTTTIVDSTIAQTQQQNSTYALLGHSLGAKYAMIHALRTPTKVSSIVIMDIAPMPYPAHNRIYIETYKKVLEKKPSNRKEAVHYLSQYVDDAPTLFFLAKNFYFENTTLRLHINLEELDRHYETLCGFPQELQGYSFDAPVLFLRAEHTDYFSDEAEPYIKQYFTNYRIKRIPNSTHILHIDNPIAVQKALQEFYEEIK